MMKTIMRNKLQFLLTVLTNLLMYMIVIVAIVLKVETLNDLESVIAGILFTIVIVTAVRKYEKSKRFKMLVLFVSYIVLVRYITTLFLEPEEVITFIGMFIGFLICVYVWNSADTIHNIRIKSGLILQDLEK